MKLLRLNFVTPVSDLVKEKGDRRKKRKRGESLENEEVTCLV